MQVEKLDLEEIEILLRYSKNLRLSNVKINRIFFGRDAIIDFGDLMDSFVPRGEFVIVEFPQGGGYVVGENFVVEYHELVDSIVSDWVYFTDGSSCDLLTGSISLVEGDGDVLSFGKLENANFSKSGLCCSCQE